LGDEMVLEDWYREWMNQISERRIRMKSKNVTGLWRLGIRNSLTQLRNGVLWRGRKPALHEKFRYHH
jgi:hypothetical protein